MKNEQKKLLDPHQEAASGVFFLCIGDDNVIKRFPQLKHIHWQTTDSLPNAHQPLQWLIDLLGLSRHEPFFPRSACYLRRLFDAWVAASLIWPGLLNKRWEVNRVLAHHVTAGQVTRVRHRSHLKHCSARLSAGCKSQVGAFLYSGQEAGFSYCVTTELNKTTISDFPPQNKSLILNEVPCAVTLKQL